MINAPVEAAKSGRNVTANGCSRRYAPVTFESATGSIVVSARSHPTSDRKRAASAYAITVTFVLIAARVKRWTMSWLTMRMQPDETFVPIVSGSVVPWMR